MRRLLPLLAVLLALATCAARRAGPPPPPLYERAAELGARDRAAAIAELEAAARRARDPDRAAWLALAAGEQRRLAGDAEEAAAWFRRVLREAPADHPARDAAALGVALVDAEDARGPSGNALATLDAVPERAVPGTMNADRFRWLARIAADEGTSRRQALVYARKAHRYAAADPVVAARVRAALADLIGPGAAGGTAPAATAPAREAALDRARAALAARDLDAAAEAAETFLRNWPDDPAAAEAQGILDRARAGDPAVGGLVGVMLPLSGTYAPAGRRIREVVQWVAEEGGGRITPVFVDTTSTEPAAAVDELVLRRGAVLLLGPLLGDHVRPAAERAQALGTPIVTLSQSADARDAGEFVFRGFLSLEAQAGALARHAVGAMGLRRFAVLHPDTPYGAQARDLFAAAVERAGGSVVRTVAYDPAATDFRDAARELGQKDYQARAAEWARLKRRAREEGVDLSKVVLPPLVDFDAIFVPDDWRRVPLVASALAFEEFPVGDFRPHRHDEPIPLLGLNAWDDPRIVEAGGQYVQRAVFVDAFVRSDPAARAFAERYEARFGRPPGVIDAVIHDAAHLAAAAALAGGDDRAAVRDELLRARLAEPTAGGERFDADRSLAFRVRVLTIDGEEIRPWNPDVDAPAEPAP